jgi:starch synthase (maltosyl-transferring)
MMPDFEAARIVIEAVSPLVDGGLFPVKRIAGETVTVQADIYTDGHEKLAASLVFQHQSDKAPQSVPMTLLNNDRWQAQFTVAQTGFYTFYVTAWFDEFGSFVADYTAKTKAGVATSVDLREGQALAHAILGPEAPEDAEILLSAETRELIARKSVKKFKTSSARVTIDVDRTAAGVSAWYEIFPRSQSGDETRHGTFDDVITQLPRIAQMGFDVLYFPPIHPIGRTNRKGKNNVLKAGPDDHGSPYAIGAAEGGHTAIHPDLGTLSDFQRLLAAAKETGLEVALDFAIQCAPDHPWLREHPEWFAWRADGSLRYAENPPKKYEDIVNVDFYAPKAMPGLWLALRDAVQFWVDQGIRIFRVDNPHTKPLPFWQWMIADIRSRNHDVLFLSEAFTKPKMMYRLAKIGFSQSYTYFTWRNTKLELEAYINEITTSPVRDFFRPHFFVNTPDINPFFLQSSGRGGFLIRAALAATLSGLWGVYNGFELCEAEPVSGKEEYLDSEKYQIRRWDHERPGNIVAEISALNAIRHANTALQQQAGVEFLPCNNGQVLYYRKFATDGNVLLIAISLDPHSFQDAVIELPLWRWGLADDGRLQAEDLMRGDKFVWQGKYQTVRLNPFEIPFCIWRVAPIQI